MQYLWNGLQMEIKLTVAALIGQMRIAIDTSKTSVRKPEDLIENLRLQLTMVQKEGVHLRMQSRVPAATSC